MAPNASASATKYCERYFIGFYSTCAKKTLREQLPASANCSENKFLGARAFAAKIGIGAPSAIDSTWLCDVRLSRESGKSLSDHFVREFLKIQVYDEAKCLWTYQIHRIHPNMPAATMMGIGLMWDFQKRIVHAAVIT
jgi:hypothetical protein